MKSYKVDHAIVTPYHVGKNISKNVYNSWMLYYARGHYVRSHIAEISASQQFLIDSQIDTILNNANHLDYVIVTWFGTYMDDMWNWHDDCIEYIEQLNNYIGKELELKTRELIDGKRKFTGILEECDGAFFSIKNENELNAMKFKFTDIDLCKLKPNYNNLLKLEGYSYGK